MNEKKGKRIVVGLSGGVDSSVAAYLLKEQGYDVVGLFMKNWHDTSVTISKECPWLEDSNDAMMVAQSLGIPFSVVDLSEIYREKVVDYMFSEYEKGRTPNPDVLCNREIKFDVFLHAAQEIGADMVATGHYARVETMQDADGKTIYRLLCGTDGNKDQSYFLCQLSQEQLSHAMFPIGDLEKPRVREIAASLGLVTAEKKDSQGICFVGKVKLPEFLKQKLSPRDGEIVEIPASSPIYSSRAKKIAAADGVEKMKLMSEKFHYTPQDGKTAGVHHGAHFFTCGQRKGLDVGGHAFPLFVIDTCTQTNTVYVGEGKDHPGLYRRALFIASRDEHWVREDMALSCGESMEVMVRIRYRQPLEAATMHKTEEGIYMVFSRPQSAVTAGQFAAAYVEDELIFSGVIN